jgi:hypothetical protein
MDTRAHSSERERVFHGHVNTLKECNRMCHGHVNAFSSVYASVPWTHACVQSSVRASAMDTRVRAVECARQCHGHMSTRSRVYAPVPWTRSAFGRVRASVAWTRSAFGRVWCQLQRHLNSAQRNVMPVQALHINSARASRTERRLPGGWPGGILPPPGAAPRVRRQDAAEPAGRMPALRVFANVYAQSPLSCGTAITHRSVT